MIQMDRWAAARALRARPLRLRLRLPPGAPASGTWGPPALGSRAPSLPRGLARARWQPAPTCSCRRAGWCAAGTAGGEGGHHPLARAAAMRRLRERGSGKAVLYTDSATGETRAVSAGVLERARRLEQLEAQVRRTAPRERRWQPGEAVALLWALQAILWLVGQLVRLVKAAAAAVAGVWSGASAGGAPAGGGTCERAAAGGGTRTNHGGPSTRAGGRR